MQRRDMRRRQKQLREKQLVTGEIRRRVVNLELNLFSQRDYTKVGS